MKVINMSKKRFESLMPLILPNGVISTESIIYNYKGGPVGIDTLTATIGEENGTIEDMYEPYLLQIGFIARTPRGRIVTEKAYKHLKIDMR